MRRSCAQLKQL